MYFLPECFISESNLEPLRWNIRWTLLQKLSMSEYHSANSKPLLTFSKSQVADLFAN